MYIAISHESLIIFWIFKVNPRARYWSHTRQVLEPHLISFFWWPYWTSPLLHMPSLWQISLLSNRVVTLPWQVSMPQPQQIFGANRTIMRKPQGGLQSWPWKRYQPWFLFSSLRRWSKHTCLKYPSGNLNWLSDSNDLILLENRTKVLCFLAMYWIYSL